MPDDELYPEFDSIPDVGGKTGYSFPVIDVDIPMPMVRPPKCEPHISAPDGGKDEKNSKSSAHTPTPAADA